MSILLGNGAGAFQSAVTYAGAAYPQAVIVGEFNGDGKADLAVMSVGNSGTGTMGILLGGAVPDLAMSISHGTGFTQGQIGASYKLTVSNIGGIAATGVVGVTETLSAGLTATAISGDGWTCVLATLTCTRSDSLAPATSYPAITVVVNVGVIPGILTNVATVSDGEESNLANNTAVDSSAARTAITIGLASTPNPSTFGQAVTLTATVPAGTTGKATFYDGTNVLGTATLAGTQATLTTSLLPAGSHTLRARYLGDANYGPSLSAIQSQTVTSVAINGFQPPAAFKLTTPNGLQSVTAGDFNGDGKADLLVVNNGTNGVSVLLGKGDGHFSPR